jgi:hypothetical protein
MSYGRAQELREYKLSEWNEMPVDGAAGVPECRPQPENSGAAYLSELLPDV